MKNHKCIGRSNVVTIILLLRMITEAVCFLQKYFRILGVVSGNKDEGYGPLPNIQVSAFQSSVIPTQKAHPFNTGKEYHSSLICLTKLSGQKSLGKRVYAFEVSSNHKKTDKKKDPKSLF